MPQPLGNGDDVLTRLNQQRSLRVPQVMQANIEVVLRTKAVKVFRKVVGAVPLAKRTCEYRSASKLLDSKIKESIMLEVSMQAQPLQSQRINCYRTLRCVGLRRLEPNPVSVNRVFSADLDERVSNVNDAVVKIDVIPNKSAHLTASHTGCQRQATCHRKALIRMPDEQRQHTPHFVLRKDIRFRLAHTWRLDAVAWVAGEQLERYRALKRRAQEACRRSNGLARKGLAPHAAIRAQLSIMLLDHIRLKLHERNLSELASETGVDDVSIPLTVVGDSCSTSRQYTTCSSKYSRTVIPFLRMSSPWVISSVRQASRICFASVFVRQ